LTIIVTGAAGLLGANLVLTLSACSHKVVALCRDWRFQPPGAEILTADLTEETAVRRLFDGLRFDCVVHCAAASDVDWCELNVQDAQRQNVGATRFVAEAARRAGAQMVYLSTDAVYDGRHGPHVESESPLPRNVYARTKLQGERETLRVLGDSALILRTTLYGWNAKPKHSLGEWVLDKLERAEPVPGFTDVVFSPLLANHLAAIIASLVARNAVGILNVGGSEAISKYEFAIRIAEVFGYDPSMVLPRSIDEVKLAAARAKDTSLVTSRLETLLGRRPPDARAGLVEMKRLRDVGYAERLKSYTNGENHVSV
jgi:dTDP-4-dehydrorhamnose reductase